jgi:hypothetical protein
MLAPCQKKGEAMTITKLFLIASMSLSGSCIAQTLHSFPGGQNTPTNRYFCPAGVATTVKVTAGIFTNMQRPNVPMPPVGGGRPVLASDSVCIDLSSHPEAVVLLMQQEKHHADRIAVMERQAAATEKLATQMDAWMKRSEQDLRSAIDAKFKALPIEIVSSKAHMASLENLRAEILNEVTCKRDPGISCN